jgi:hypothetical protein
VLPVCSADRARAEGGKASRQAAMLSVSGSWWTVEFWLWSF